MIGERKDSSPTDRTQYQVPVTLFYAGPHLSPLLHTTPYGQGPVVEEIEHFAFEQGSSLSEHRYHMHCFGCPVYGHEPRKRRVAIGHLDRKRQVSDILEEPEKYRDMIVLEVSLPDHEAQYVKPSH